MTTKPLAIAVKGFKEMFRNLKSTAIIFILPIVFMGVFAIVFGQEPSETTFNVGLIKNDSSEFQEIVTELKDQETPEGKQVFEFTEFEESEPAKTALEKGNLEAMFAWDNGVLVIQGDSQNPFFNAVVGATSQIVNQFYASQAPQGRAQFREIERLRVESVLEDREGEITGFQYLAPGLIIYGILMLVPYVTDLLAALVQKKEIFRYFTSKASSFDIFSGNLLFLMFVGFIQTYILYGVAELLGADFQGSLLIAILIAIPTCLFAIGLGMLIGTFAGKPQEASGLASIATIILGFLSGSFVQFPTISLGEFLGRTWEMTDLIPTAHASSALRGVFLFEQDLENVSFEIGFLFVSSLIIFVVGVLSYQQVRLKKLEG